MIEVSVVLNILIVVFCMLMIVQMGSSRSGMALAYRIILGSIAVPYILKIQERIKIGDTPTFIDLFGEFALFVFFAVTIWSHRHRFKKI